MTYKYLDSGNLRYYFKLNFKAVEPAYRIPEIKGN